LSRATGTILAVLVIAGMSASGVYFLSAVHSFNVINAAQVPTTQRSQPTTRPSFATTRPIPIKGPVVRVAVIGGMVFTGFWDDLAKRYEAQSGVHVQLMAAGPKHDIAAALRNGGADVITMHSSDTMINLVADGYTMDPQPWLRNDLIIVGPPDDPAGIKDMTDAQAALQKIAQSKSNFVVHSSLGSQEVLLNILEPAQITLDPAHTTVLFNDGQRDVLLIAAQKHAYTLVGRIPFRIGRLPNNGLIGMVQGDPRLMRPYLVAVSNPKRIPGANLMQAKQFAVFLRSSETQSWIAEYGKGTMDARPTFFPVAADK